MLLVAASWGMPQAVRMSSIGTRRLPDPAAVSVTKTPTIAPEMKSQRGSEAASMGSGFGLDRIHAATAVVKRLTATARRMNRSLGDRPFFTRRETAAMPTTPPATTIQPWRPGQFPAERWAIDAVSLDTTSVARPVDTATDGRYPAMMSSGVRSEPVPIPVAPISVPPSSPNNASRTADLLAERSGQHRRDLRTRELLRQSNALTQ